MWRPTELRLLVIEPRDLFPRDTGAKILSGSILAHLSRWHEVTLLVNVDPTEPAEQTAQMQELCRELVTVPWKDLRNFTARFYLELARCLITSELYAARKFCTPKLKRRAAELASEGRFDVVIWDTISAFMPDVDFGPLPRIALAHNIEHRLRERQAERASRRVSRLYLRYYARRTRAYEVRAFRRADHVVTVSPADAAYIRDELGIEHVSSLPAGVDTGYFAPQSGEAEVPSIVFTGSMDWQANQDAVRFFISSVLPEIEAAVPDVRFVVVGRQPPPDIRSLAAAAPGHVEVTGTVDDVRPYLDKAQVAVVPVLFGSGIKLKVFEAMAMAKPVVVSTIGAEGLPLVDGENAFVADSAADMAARCVQLLRDRDLRCRVGKQARNTVLAGHDWSIVASELARICEDAVRRRT